jgi:IS5 family transposase
VSPAGYRAEDFTSRVSRVRSKVEWPFRILKRVFGYNNVRYRGLKKNHEWLLAAFALVNLYQHCKRLVTLGA